MLLVGEAGRADWRAHRVGEWEDGPSRSDARLAGRDEEEGEDEEDKRERETTRTGRVTCSTWLLGRHAPHALGGPAARVRPAVGTHQQLRAAARTGTAVEGDDEGE
ncbi:unnamed protein product [Prorocentrum cordatum]|uniref:Uncharacterized protein n=1 Tax=Prorocentrum cordatum TaxID=2364126 RepID=A0ABN9S2H2_9DINO|nr:unnamed protein product [Polarella glacialis]